MANPIFKNIIVAGATGTIGAPIVTALLAHGSFSVSALTRPSSTAVFPPGVIAIPADLTSHASLVAALKGQDALIITLNDETAPLQPGIIQAAFEADVKRVFPNEWANHEMVVPGTMLEDVRAGKTGLADLLEQKAGEAKNRGKEFTWTGVDCGVFIDWALYAGFVDITLPPNGKAKIWDTGDNVTSCTTLATVAKAVVAILTNPTAEQATRNRLINIESFGASQNDIVKVLEGAAGEKWEVEKTTTEKELQAAGELLEGGEFLPAYYTWMKAFIFGNGSRLKEVENEFLKLENETLEEVVGRVVKR